MVSTLNYFVVVFTHSLQILDDELPDDDDNESDDSITPEDLILTSEDRIHLIEQVLELIKNEDKNVYHAFSKTLSRIKWSEIDIPGFTPEQLEAEFKRVIQPVKKVRTLTEVLKDYNANSKKYLSNAAADFPKQPATAYTLFCVAYRDKVTKKLGGRPPLVRGTINLGIQFLSNLNFRVK